MEARWKEAQPVAGGGELMRNRCFLFSVLEIRVILPGTLLAFSVFVYVWEGQFAGFNVILCSMAVFWNRSNAVFSERKQPIPSWKRDPPAPKREHLEPLRVKLS